MTSCSPAGIAVQQLLDEYRQQLATQRVQAATDDGDAPQLAYFGTWQDPIPRELIVDQVLRPADKIVWQVLRTHIGDPRRPVVSPGHEDIARAANVSRNTVLAALTALRLQGWIVTCAGQVRSEHATDRGRFRQQTYLLHDRPPTLAERLALGTDYLQFVHDSALHSSRHIRAIAYGLLDHLRAYVLDGTGPFAEQSTPSVYEMSRDNAADQAVADGRIRQRIEVVEAVASLAGSVPQAGEAADENDGECGETDEGADETCGEPAEMAPASSEPHPVCAAEEVVNETGRGATLASKRVSFEQRIAEIQRKNTTNPARQNLRTAETAEKPAFEPCANFEHGLQSSSSCIKDTTTVHVHTREDDEPYWLPPDVRALLQASELAMIVSSVETILEGPQAKLRQLVIDEWAGQLRLEAQGLRDPNDPIHRRCSYLRGMALRAARANPGRQGFNLTLVGKAIGDERRRAQSREPEAVPEQIRPTIPARPQPGSPKLPPKAPADPGALRHASEMAAHWQQRVEHTESEKAPKAVRDSARSNLDFWQTEVLRLSAGTGAMQRAGKAADPEEGRI